MSGLQAEEVTINLAGSHILGFNGQAIVAVSGRDREITHEDVRRAIDSACAIQLPAGREIVDRLPQEFIVDDQDGINDPVGMIGARLAVKVHIVTSPVTARQNAINAVNRAGLVVADMVLEQLAAAEASLSDDDKEFGAAQLAAPRVARCQIRSEASWLKCLRLEVARRDSSRVRFSATYCSHAPKKF